MMKPGTFFPCFLTCFSILILLCVPEGPRPVTPEEPSYTCTWNGTDSIDWLDSVTCPDDFTRLEGLPLIQAYGNVKSIKIVYTIDSGLVFFTDSRKYELHYDFCKRILGYTKTIADYNREQYGDTPERIYILATINYFTSSEIYTLECVAGDKISADQVRTLFEAVSPRTFFSDSLRFMPTSSSMEEKVKILDGIIPMISSDEIYKGQNYQALNEAEAYGYLTRLNVEKVESSYISRRAIVLTNGVPNDISVVAGIITTEFQTPLSHINVLSRNRGTPNMALRDGWESPLLSGLEGKLIYMKVALDTFTVREANLTEAEAFWAEKDPTDTMILKCNDSTPGLYEIAELSHNSIDLVGAKAANFAELGLISNSDPGPIPLPEGGFAIPFYYYRQHLRKHGIDQLVEAFLSDSSAIADANIRMTRLESLRDTITAATIDSSLLAAIITKIELLSEYRRIRFRSSTNAEDLQEFNGAGLYSSKTGIIGGSPDRGIERAVKCVWASLWNFRAFEERDYFKIDHRTVAMGILAHRSFPDELANGVAITKNIYNENIWGHTINVQTGETSVVDPPAGTTSDQIIFYTFFEYEDPYTDPVIEYISHSSITGGAPVLSDTEITLLAKHLSSLKDHFYKVFKPWEKGQAYPYFGMDVEFKFDSPDRKLYIKQARWY